jgi:hypothetical protein
MISVSSQGPGRPFLLTKYRGGIFSSRGGPVFGWVLGTSRFEFLLFKNSNRDKHQGISSEGAPGGANRADSGGREPSEHAILRRVVAGSNAQEGGFEEKNVKNTAPASHEARPKNTCHMRTKFCNLCLTKGMRESYEE